MPKMLWCLPGTHSVYLELEDASGAPQLPNFSPRFFPEPIRRIESLCPTPSFAFGCYWEVRARATSRS